MTKPALGRLEKVDLRKYWESESSDFTPWLAQEENMVLLGDALGLELEVEDVERDVGSFRADILCKVIGTEERVLIENQLEKTNHDHLGQIITYAAGLDVRTIVWIAKRFTEEHREALMWLNEVSQDDFRFFGLEVELWRIGESVPAPKFNIVAKPNDWAKSVRGSTGGGIGSTSDQNRLAYWSAFCEEARKRNTTLRVPDPQPRHSMHFRLGRAGISLSAVASTYNSESHSYGIGELRAQLLIQGPKAQEVYRALLRDRRNIDAEFGSSLDWSESEEVNRRRVSVRLTADIQDRDRWPEQHAWLLANLEGLKRVFAPRIRAIGVDEESGTEA